MYDKSFLTELPIKFKEILVTLYGITVFRLVSALPPARRLLMEVFLTSTGKDLKQLKHLNIQPGLPRWRSG